MEKLMATGKKAATKRQQAARSEIDVQVDKVLGKLVEQEPRLKAILSQAIDNGNGPTDIADHTVQIYRQKLREE